MRLQMTAPEVQAFLAEVFPQLAGRFAIAELAPFRAVVRMTAVEADLRPGGTVSGPALFTLADCAFYIALLAMIGPVALTVTSNACIDFLRKPLPGRLAAEARILKLGRSLAVGDVLIRCDGVDGAVARASLTYSIPPRSPGAAAGSP